MDKESGMEASAGFADASTEESVLGWRGTRFKRSASWSAGLRVEDEVAKRAEELLEKVNRNSLESTADPVRESLVEVRRNVRRLSIKRRRSYLAAVEEDSVFDSGEQNVPVDENGSGPLRPRANSCSPGTPRKKGPVRRSRSFHGGTLLSAVADHSEKEEDEHHSLVENTCLLPATAISGSSPHGLNNELYEVMCEQERQSPSNSNAKLVIGLCPKVFQPISKCDEIIAFPSNKTYTDLSTTLTDGSNLRV